MTRHRWAAFVCAAAMVTLAGCDADGDGSIGSTGSAGSTRGPGSTASAVPEEEVMAVPSSDVVAAPQRLDPSMLPTRASGSGATARVAAGVIPPTNRWYSGLVFGNQPYPAFASPLSFVSTDAGFAWGVPHVGVSVDGNVIISPASSDVNVTVEGATGLPTATAAGPVSVTLAYGAADVTLAAGSPVVSISAEQPVTLTVAPAPTSRGDQLWALVVGERTYGIATEGATVEGSTITVAAGGSVQMFAVPDDGEFEDTAAAIGPAVGEVEVGYRLEGGEATTSLTYAPEGEPTLVAVPKDRAGELGCDLGSYPSVNGDLLACSASSIAWSVPAIEPSLRLDLSTIAPDRRSEIVAALEQEASAQPAFLADTYFGGKILHRHARLVSIADALGETALADQFAGELAEELRVWADPNGCTMRSARCFEYDEELRGVVGLEAAFGSDLFNDHHFHYGYLLNAAAVVLQRDPGLEEALAPVFDLVAADIASPAGSDHFPTLRAFDPYAGHSWAGGFAPHGDGNDQESTSEAVLAWNGVAAWAQARGDDALTQTAQWMLSAEADAAVSRWLRPDLEGFEEYQHEIVSLVWGGKREHATWFSAEPSAMLGIQLIPMAPIQRHLAPEDEGASATVLRSLSAAAPDGYEVLFGDLLLMYYALIGPAEASIAWDAAIDLPDEVIDNGNSRAALLAWIAALE
ncbi:MAG: glycosyl hydrolase [Demequina sp.]